MTLGVGATDELDVPGLDAALDDPGSTTSAGAALLRWRSRRESPGAAASPEQPARPTNTPTTRAAANLLVINRTPSPLCSNPSTITATATI